MTLFEGYEQCLVDFSPKTALSRVSSVSIFARGGIEYNPALGQRRAQALRKAMHTPVVSEGQMEAVSFGQEKPNAPGHDETAWAQNRRLDIVY